MNPEIVKMSAIIIILTLSVGFLLVSFIKNAMDKKESKKRNLRIIKAYEEQLSSRNVMIKEAINRSQKADGINLNLSYYVSVLEAEIVASKGRVLPKEKRKLVEDYMTYLMENNPELLKNVDKLLAESRPAKKRKK